MTKTPLEHTEAAANKARQAALDKARPDALKHPVKERDAGQATKEAIRADRARPAEEKDAVATMADAHRDNVNPNAYSAESARKLGHDDATPSINEPKPGEQVAFKVPEDHTVTTPEALAQAYPDGYRRHEEIGNQEQFGQHHPPPLRHADLSTTDDPDDLEDEIAQAKEEGDFKSMHRTPPRTTPRSPDKWRK